MDRLESRSLSSVTDAVRTIKHYAAEFPYEFCDDARPCLFVADARNPDCNVLNALPIRSEWLIDDMVCFDGRDFAALATSALRRRMPRPSEYERFEADGRVWKKLDFILELDAENRRENRLTKVRGIETEARLWRLAGRLGQRRLAVAQSLVMRMFRARARRLASRLAPGLSLRRLAFECLHRVNEMQARTARPARRVVIANFYPVWPVTHGGQRRVFFLARELSKRFDVEIVVPDRQGNSAVVFGPSLKEIRIGTEASYDRLVDEVDRTVEMAKDAAYAMHWRECRAYQRVLAQRVVDADVVISAHPYSIDALLHALDGRAVPILYDAHNVEVRLKAPLLETHPAYLDAVRRVERTALERAGLTVSCSDDDRDGIVAAYGVERSRIRIVENGVDAVGVPVLPPDVRDRARADLGFGSRLVAVFGGSYHHPNFRAVDRILDVAERLPRVVFVFVGTVCGHAALNAAAGRENIVRLGEIDESSKWIAYQVADVGLNPMEVGSGSNIKVFEYAAAGLAVLTTAFGARGVGPSLREHLIVAEPDGFESMLGVLATQERAALRRRGAGSRAAAVATADWSTIGRRYADAVGSLVRTATKEGARPWIRLAGIPDA